MSLKRTRTPAHLLTDGGKLWRDVVAEYGISDPAGLALLTTAGECLDRMRAAQTAIKQHGEIVVDRYGAPKLNPACNLEKDARNGMLAALRALNLDLEPLRDAAGRPPSPSGWKG
jgi:P27 family predicted phage terminase small subunit